MTFEKQVQAFLTDEVSRPDLGSAFDWLCRIGNLLQLIRITTQIWVVIQHQYGILRAILRCHFSGKPVVSSRNDGCFLRQVKISELCRLTVTLVSWLLKNVTLLSLNKVAIWSNNLIGQCFFIYHHSPWSSLGPAVIQIYNNVVLMLCYFQH